MPVNDRQLIIDYAKNGSQAAFAELTCRYIKLVHATCFRELRNRELAEDATQVVFLLLARKAPGLRHKGQLAGWMFHTSRLVSKNAARLERGRAIREQKNMELAMETSEQDAIEWRPVDSCLNEALESLAGSERDIILMRFFQEMTLEETGASLHISEDAARMRVNRAIEKLRCYLAKHGVTTPVTVLAGLLAANSVADASTARAAEIARIASETGAGHIAAGTLGAHAAQLLQGVQRTMLITKLAATAAVITVATGGAFGAYPLIVGGHYAKINADVKNSTAKPDALNSLINDARLHSFSESRISKLAYDCVLYMQDHQMTFPDLRDATVLRATLKRYDPVADTFIQPGTNEPYLMNPAISNVKLARLADPMTAVMFYDAVPDKTGNLVVVFADAHSELIAPDRWTELKKTLGQDPTVSHTETAVDKYSEMNTMDRFHLSQLAVCYLSYLQDHDMKSPDLRDLSALQRMLTLYGASSDIWNQSGTNTPYQVNTALSKLTLAQIASPRDTVIFYEAAPNKDGLRMVSFVDSHSDVITAEQWKKMEQSIGKSVPKESTGSQLTDAELHALSAERLKQYAYGYVRYLQMNEEKAPNLEDPDATLKAILPYVKSTDPFVQPGASVPYKMNGPLANLQLAVIDSPETAVLFYDAVPDKDGNREVEYYDATSELVPPAKWAALSTAISLAEPEAKRRAISESRLTDYDYGFKQYLLDHDNTLPDMHDLTAFQNELRSYVKSTDDFIQPGASKPYQVNSSLSKLPLAQIAKPSITVLFYESVADTRGRRCVAFVDGRTELISSEFWAQIKPKSPL